VLREPGLLLDQDHLGIATLAGYQPRGCDSEDAPADYGDTQGETGGCALAPDRITLTISGIAANQRSHA
jgi:hypothetical protein